MRIAIIGGLERNGRLLVRLAEDAGHTLELHTGQLKGRGVEGLRAAVERADVVLVPLDINSHGAVQLAGRLGRELGRPVVVLRTSGTARFRALIAELGAGRAPLAA